MRAIESSAERKPSKLLVWIVDSEQWPRVYLHAELLERGYEVVGFEDLLEALSLLEKAHVLQPHVIVIELRGQRMKGRPLKLMASTNVPFIGIGGAVELNNPLIKKFKWTELVRRPVTIGRVADVVEKVIRGD